MLALPLTYFFSNKYITVSTPVLVMADKKIELNLL